MSTNIQLFQGHTLVDITATGVIRSNNVDSQDRNQQRNWETLLQCIGLRTQPHNITEPQAGMGSMKLFDFGDFYEGGQKVWTWTWTIESAGVYDLPGKPLGALLQDLEQVPIITGLNETAKFMLPIFYPHGTIKNIYIKQINIE